MKVSETSFSTSLFIISLLTCGSLQDNNNVVQQHVASNVHNSLRYSREESQSLGSLIATMVKGPELDRSCDHVSAFHRHVHVIYDQSWYGLQWHNLVEGIDQCGILSSRFYPSQSYGNTSDNKLSNDFLSSILKPRDLTHQPRWIVLLTHINNTLDIFNQIALSYLESTYTKWLLVTKSEYTEDLATVLREGSQVTVAVQSTTSTYQLWGSYIDPQGQYRFDLCGTWEWKAAQEKQMDLPRGYLRHIAEQGNQNLNGRQLKAVVVNYWPPFKIEQLPSGEWVPVSGYEYTIMKTIAETMNFTVKIVGFDDFTLSWGNVQADGSITGMIGMVARREVDFAIDDMTITGSRESVIDFSDQYLHNPMVLITPSRKERDKTLAIFEPFPVLVWILIGLSIVVMAIAWWILIFVDVKETFGINTLFILLYNAYRILLNQSNQVTLKTWNQRLLLFSWYYFALIIYVLYNGNLISSFLTPALDPPIDSLEDVVTAIDHGYTFALLEETSSYYIFQEATHGLYHKIWNMIPPDERVIKHFDSFLQNKIIPGKYLTAVERVGAMGYVVKSGKSRLRIGKEAFYPSYYGIACFSGAPFRQAFSQILMHLNEGGLVDKWIQEELEKESLEQKTSDTDDNRALGLQHLQAAFMILVLGIGISTIIFIAEFLYHNLRGTHKQ